MARVSVVVVAAAAVVFGCVIGLASAGHGATSFVNVAQRAWTATDLAPQQARRLALHETHAQYAAAPLVEGSAAVNCTQLGMWLVTTNSNSYNWLLWDTTETRAGRCSVPADSPLTAFNETSFFNTSKGNKGCNDYVAWSQVLGRLAAQFTGVVAVNVDDFCPGNVAGPPYDGLFTNSMLTTMADNLHNHGAPWLALVPTFYYSEQLEATHSLRFVLSLWPNLPTFVDGILFYFRNERQGDAPCAAAACPVPPPRDRCWYGCLAGSCAEATVPHMPVEVQAFRNATPPDMPIILGMYAVHESACGTPSHKYVQEMMATALPLSTLSGLMVYTMQHPTTNCSNVVADEGCIVQQEFGRY